MMRRSGRSVVNNAQDYNCRGRRFDSPASPVFRMRLQSEVQSPYVLYVCVSGTLNPTSSVTTSYAAFGESGGFCAVSHVFANSSLEYCRYLNAITQMRIEIVLH